MINACCCKDGALLGMFAGDCGLVIRDLGMIMINEFATVLQARFELYTKGDFEAFLGVAIEKQIYKTIRMHQQGLIKKIIKAAHMEGCNLNQVPAAQGRVDPTGTPSSQTPWRYSSIVRMLLYHTAINTRTDIQFAIRQVARFNSSPKIRHESAVHTIFA